MLILMLLLMGLKPNFQQKVQLLADGSLMNILILMTDMRWPKPNCNPLAQTEAHLAEGKELYGLYCAVCHGKKGDGQGILMTREKFLGVPSYADREITEGSIYHVLMYGKNAMGSHAGQVNATERWQIAQHVMELRSALLK